MPGEPTPIRFATQSYKSASLPLSAQDCVNFYAERQPKDAKSDIAVFGCPGIVDFASCGVGPVRGFHVMGETLYVVSGGFLWRVDDDGDTTQLGGQVSGSGQVSMDDNGTQVEIVNGTNGYIYDATGGFRLITDSDFHAASTVTYADSFFVLPRDGTSEFFISDPLDGTSYSDFFANAEWKSDNIRAVVNHLERLNVFGTRSIEFWGVTGDANFPYRPLKGAGLERGIIGAHAWTTDDDSIVFVDNKRQAFRIGQGQGVISHPAVTQAWQKYQVASDAIAFSFTFDGHVFNYITFPTQGVTWGFDKTSGLIHRRESWDANNQSIGRWRINCAVEVYGKVLVGDCLSGKVGALDRDAYTEWGNTIRGLLVAPPLHGNGRRVFMPRLELDIETGVGLASGQGSDPQIMLDHSDDGGRTFSTPQLWQSMGEAGEYRKRLAWRKLGSFPDSRTLRIQVTDPVRRTLIAARAPGLYVGT